MHTNAEMTQNDHILLHIKNKPEQIRHRLADIMHQDGFQFTDTGRKLFFPFTVTLYLS